jgi:hypothetical protein
MILHLSATSFIGGLSMIMSAFGLLNVAAAVARPRAPSYALRPHDRAAMRAA